MTRWIKLFLGVALFAVLLVFLDWRETARLLVGIRLTPALVGLFAVLLLGIFISSFKWSMLLSAQGINLSWRECLRTYWIGTFFSNYFPSNVGGDVVRLASIRRVGGLSAGAASIVVERATGLLVLLLLACVALWTRPHYYKAVGLLWVLGLTVLGSFTMLLVLVLLGPYLVERLNAFSSQRGTLWQRAMEKVRKLASAIGYYRQRMDVVVFASIASLPFYAALFLSQYLVFLALGVQIPMLEVLFIAPLIPLVSMLPISVNGIGLAEGAFVLFYTQAGVSPEEALAAALLRRVAQLLVSLVGGLFWLSSRRGLSAEAK